jgi:hypothetical protein
VRTPMLVRTTKFEPLLCVWVCWCAHTLSTNRPLLPSLADQTNCPVCLGGKKRNLLAKNYWTITWVIDVQCTNC